MAKYKKSAKILKEAQQVRGTVIQGWLLGLIIVLAAIAAALLILLNVFVVNTVVVENNQLYDDSVIENAVLNDNLSWNSLYVYLKYRFVQTEEFPFIDDLKVSLNGPQTLVIKVEEKAILGYLAAGEKEYVYFDTDGYVVEVSDRLISGIPEIKGLECGDAVAAEQLPINNITLRDLLQLMQALKRVDLVPEAITYGGQNGVVLAYENGIEVIVGDNDNLTQKLERMNAIFPKLSDKQGVLHLENWTEETTDIIFDEGETVAEEEEKEQNETQTWEETESSEEISSEAVSSEETTGEGTASEDDVSEGTIFEQTTLEEDSAAGTGQTGTTSEGTTSEGSLSDELKGQSGTSHDE